MADDHEVNAFEVVSVDGFLAAVPSLGFKGLQESGRVSVGSTGDPSTSPISVVTPEEVGEGAIEPNTGRTSTIRNPALRDFVSAKDYGVTGNGTTDDTTNLAAAATAAKASGRKLYLPAGSYKVSNSIQGTGNGKLLVVGEGPGSTELVMAAGMSTAVINAVGVLGTGVAVTAASDPGDYEVTIADTSGIVAGDYVRLLDSTQPIYGLSTRVAVSYASEWARVKSVDSSTVLTLWKGLQYGYSTSATLRRLSTPISFDISGLTVRNPSPGTLANTARGLSATYYAGLRIADCEFHGMDANAINIIRGVDAEVDRVAFYDMQDLATANTPYCIVANSAQDLLIRGLRCRYGRHVFTSGGDTTYGVASHIHISDAIATEMSASAFDTHPGTTDVTFENCHAHAAFPSATFLGTTYETSGFQLRGPDHTLIGCTAKGMPQHGAYVVYGADRAQIVGCRFSDCDIGVALEDSNDCYIGGGTMIENAATDGIRTTVNANYVGHATRAFIGETLITGDPSGYAVNNDTDIEVIYL